MIIRPASTLDVAAADAIARPSMGFSIDRAELEVARVFVATVDEVVVAVLSLGVVLDEAEIRAIAVSPAARGAGVGAALLDFGEAHLRGAGVARWFLEVHAENHAARRLYARAGFRPIDVRTRYYADGGDAHVLEKRLIGQADDSGRDA